MNILRINHFEAASRANGPGMRAVVWTQGCNFGCPGCFNPDTHDTRGGMTITAEKLVQLICDNKDNLEGLTISGGEPLYQHLVLTRVLAEVKLKTNLSVLVFTGYDWDEIQQLKGIGTFLSYVDVLIAGRYDASKRVAKGLLGSANKTVHFLSNRYAVQDLESVPQAEIILSPDGEIILSGIDPLTW